MRELWFALRYGEWQFGYSNKHEWSNKKLFGYFSMYYNGHHKVLHVWRFYIAVYY